MIKEEKLGNLFSVEPHQILLCQITALVHHLIPLAHQNQAVVVVHLFQSMCLPLKQAVFVLKHRVTNSQVSVSLMNYACVLLT